MAAYAFFSHMRMVCLGCQPQQNLIGSLALSSAYLPPKATTSTSCNEWSRTSVGQQNGPRPMVVCGVENKMRKCDTLRVKQRLQGRGIHYGHNYVQNAIERTKAERDGIICANIPRT